MSTYSEELEKEFQKLLKELELTMGEAIADMEIKEIVSYYLNAESNILEVTFRTISDSDDVLRTDNIDYSISEEYGYVLESDYFNFFEDDDEENDYMNLELELDEDVLISFLSEYYEVNPKSLPKPEYY